MNMAKSRPASGYHLCDSQKENLLLRLAQCGLQQSGMVKERLHQAASYQKPKTKSVRK